MCQRAADLRTFPLVFISFSFVGEEQLLGSHYRAVGETDSRIHGFLMSQRNCFPAALGRV